MRIKQNDILRAIPELKPYQLDYLVKIGKVKCERHGKSIERTFSMDVIAQIKKIMEKRNGR